MHDIKEKYTNIQDASQTSPIILLGILAPVSHFRMDKEGTKSAHKIASLNCQQDIPFHSQTPANRASIRKQWKKRAQYIFPFIKA